MANTFELISAVTVGSGGAASIDFTSIPADWTDLCIQWSGRTNRAAIVDDMGIKFNGSTSGFTEKDLYGNGASAASHSVAGAIGTIPAASGTANTFGSGTVYIPNYAGSSAKSYSADCVSEANSSTAYAFLIAGLNSTTSAITSLSLYSLNGSNNFVQYSTAYLYGVKNA